MGHTKLESGHTKFEYGSHQTWVWVTPNLSKGHIKLKYESHQTWVRSHQTWVRVTPNLSTGHTKLEYGSHQTWARVTPNLSTCHTKLKWRSSTDWNKTKSRTKQMQINLPKWNRSRVNNLLTCSLFLLCSRHLILWSILPGQVPYILNYFVCLIWKIK